MTNVELDVVCAGQAGDLGAVGTDTKPSLRPLDEVSKRNIRERTWTITPERLVLCIPGTTDGVQFSAGMVRAGAMELMTQLDIDSEIQAVLAAKFVYAVMRRVAVAEGIG